jgi:hypothetical protein
MEDDTTLSRRMYAAARWDIEDAIVTHNAQSVTDIAGALGIDAIERMMHVVAQQMTDDPNRLTLRHDGDRNAFFAQWMGVAGMGMIAALLYGLIDAEKIRIRHAAAARRVAKTPAQRAAARLRGSREFTPNPFGDE